MLPEGTANSHPYKSQELQQLQREAPSVNHKKTGSSSSAELLDCRPQLHGVRGTPSRRKIIGKHISTYKEGVGRDDSPEGFDSIGGQLNSQITFRLTKRVLGEMVLPKVSTALGRAAELKGLSLTLRRLLCWERWFSRRFRPHWGTAEFTNHISTYKCERAVASVAREKPTSHNSLTYDPIRIDRYLRR